ncbi:MAG: arginine--tRNA ligase [Promethearchaeota archaeon]
MMIIDKRKIAELINEYISYLSIEEIEKAIEIPPPDINFTYAFPCYKLSKQEKKQPNQISKDLEDNIKIPDYLEKIESKGPYINFRVKNKNVLQNILENEENYGRIHEINDPDRLKKLRVIVEYPSPNTNKPLHLGHVRNLLIGNTISKLFKYKGHDVFQVNLNNDRGIHICKSLVGYLNFFRNRTPDMKSDHFVGETYIKYSENENEALKQQALEVLQKWEENNTEIMELWKKMRSWALEGFKITYKKFNISFDKEYFESDFYKFGKEIILDGLEKGIFKRQENGAIIAELEDDYNLPNKILLRSDGTSIYITQDIYLAYLKKKDFNPDLSIYVVGNEQDLYFKQLFAVLDKLEFKENKYHLSYGMISLPEGKMKSREGIVVDADDLIQEMEDLAYEEVKQRYPKLSEDQKSFRAMVIGMSALRFFILKYNPKSDFIFNPKESISFEGETGPYIQYCYARIQSIISKSTEEISLDVDFLLLKHEKELKLIKQLNYFPEIVERAIETYGIHLIPQYLLTLCQAFNSFYSTCIVISENKDLERVRLLLIWCVQIVIKIGLNLLGIETLEEM